MTQTEFGFKYAKKCYVGRPHLVLLQGIASFHSITIEFYGCTGGIYRYFPRGRNEMKVHFQHRSPGEARLVAIARGKNLVSKSIEHCKFEIKPESMAPVTLPFIGDEEDDWEEKMLDIDRQFAFDDAPVLQAAGKPPKAEPFHPDAATGQRMQGTVAAKPQSLDPAQIIQERLEKRLLNRFNKD